MKFNLLRRAIQVNCHWLKVSAAELEEENKKLKAEKARLLAAEKKAGSLDAELENAEKKARIDDIKRDALKCSNYKIPTL